MRAFLAAVLAAACVVCAQPAAASTDPAPGVHVDPGSPAGKQYEIPITSARGETSGGSRGSPSGEPPTFGSGVTPSTSTARTTASTQSSRTVAHSSRTREGARHQRHASHHGTSSAGAPATVKTQADRQDTSSAGAPATVKTQADRQDTRQANQVGSSSWLPLAGGGALVLLLGCGGGLALRRRI